MYQGIYEWKYENVAQVNVLIIPNNKIDVDVLWSEEGRHYKLRLWVCLSGSSVEFGDLTGNQYGTPLHRIGLGTFVVNVAIQFLKEMYNPSTPVRGILSNPNDYSLPPDLQNKLAEGRRIFWGRFGLEILPDHYEKLAGTVGELRTMGAGLVDGKFPRCVPLSSFVQKQ